uniref:Exodeoxyribonuclease 7 large subunit n=2 Tax=Pseudothermotoga TaxID=1643951 RepID=A0A832IAL5_9THEM
MDWNEERVYTVSDITFYIENLFEGDPNLTDVTVAGEVIDCRTRNNHLFFSLKDDYASIGCILFGGAHMQVHLESGQMVQVTGDVRVYAPRGQYRLLCKKLKLLSGRGAMFLKLKETYEKLNRMGVFSRPKKKLPRFPSLIGVITSRDSAAFQDIVRTISERFPFVKLVLYHTSVQGESAKEEILRALSDANLRELDVVIIARGGGAKEDLWLFNDEEVVMSVYELRHPVITGVGHQIDTVLVDLVADVAAHTPTAAAQYAVPDIRDVMNGVQQSLGLCYSNVLRILNNVREHSEELLLEMKGSVIESLEDFRKLSQQRLEEMKSAIDRKIDSLNQRMELLGAKLNLLDPISELKRGYVIVEKDGVRMVSKSQLSHGDVLVIRFHDGSVRVIVDEDRRYDERA